MKKLTMLLMPILLVALSATAWAGEKKMATDLILATGGHWVAASVPQKRAYLFGIGNLLEIEQAMAGEDYAAMRVKSVGPVLLNGLSGVSIADMVTQLDKYYADHADQINRPIIEVMYIEMALPRLGS